MKKILLAILIAIFTIGCSDRDDNIITPEQEITVNISIDSLKLIYKPGATFIDQYYYYTVAFYDYAFIMQNDKEMYMIYGRTEEENIPIGIGETIIINKELGEVTLENEQNRYKMIVDMYEKEVFSNNFSRIRNVGVYSGAISHKKGNYTATLMSTVQYEIEVYYTIK